MKQSAKGLFLSMCFFVTLAAARVSCGAAEDAGSGTDRDRGGPPSPFETLTLGIHFVSALDERSVGGFWDPQAGGRIEAGMPFYWGKVHVGIHVFDNRSQRPDIPGFLSSYFYLGWGIEVRFPSGFIWCAAVNAGDFYMDFDDESGVSQLRTESELGFGVGSRIAFETRARWRIELGGEHRRVLTERSIAYDFISFGVGRTFETPRWLKEFME